MSERIIDLNSMNDLDATDFSLFATGRYYSMFLRKENGSSSLPDSQQYLLMAAFLIGDIKSFDQDEFDEEFSALFDAFGENHVLTPQFLEKRFETISSSKPTKRQYNLVAAASQLESMCERNKNTVPSEFVQYFKW
jgi:hypothetical protein